MAAVFSLLGEGVVVGMVVGVGVVGVVVGGGGGGGRGGGGGGGGGGEEEGQALIP